MAELILTTTVGVGNSASGLGLNYLYPLQTVAGRSYLTLRGSTLAGGIEMSTSEADANGVTVGMVQFSDKNSTNTNDKRVATITTTLDGTTANNRGGAIQFSTRSDGGTAITTRLTITNNGKIYTPYNTLDDGAGNMKLQNGTTDTPEIRFHDPVNNTFSFIDQVSETFRVIASYRGGTAKDIFNIYIPNNQTTIYGDTVLAQQGGTASNNWSSAFIMQSKNSSGTLKYSVIQSNPDGALYLNQNGMGTGIVMTKYNTLDDGTGNASFMGLNTAGQVIGGSAGNSVTPFVATVKTSNASAPNVIKLATMHVRTAAGTDWVAVDTRLYRQVDSSSFQFLNFEGGGDMTADFTSLGLASSRGFQAYNGGYTVKMVPYSNSDGLFNPFVTSGSTVLTGGNGNAASFYIVPWSGSSCGIKLASNGVVSTPRNTLDDGSGGMYAVSSMSALGLVNRGFDFILGSGDQSSRGDSGGSRALVKNGGSVLVINFSGDFTGGVDVQGSKLTFNSRHVLRTASGGYIVQSGSSSMAGGGNISSAGGSIYYPVAFSSPPTVFLSLTIGSSNYAGTVTYVLTNVTASYFQYGIYSYSSQPITINWYAIGS